MNIDALRREIWAHNAAHPDLKNCIYYGCSNKIDESWDNKVLCREHNLLFLYWFYELSGYRYCPETFDFPSGKPLPKPNESDADMTAYRKRYCDWIASLSPDEYTRILKWSIGDEEGE